MSTSHAVRRTVAVVLATAGLVGGAAATASAHPHHHRPQPRIVIDDVDLNRHHRGGTVTLENQSHRGANLSGWKLCDQSFNCQTIRHVYVKAHDEVTLKVRFLDRHDKKVLLFNQNWRFVDSERVHSHR